MDITRRQALAMLACAGATPAQAGARWAAAEVEARVRAAPPERLRPGWSVFCLQPGSRHGARLRWSRGLAGPARLRITVAFDARENLRVRARTLRSRTWLGVFDVRFAYPLQPFELPLSGQQTELASGEGVELTLVDGRGPLWLFGAETPEEFGLLGPHLHSDDTAGAAAFEQALESLAVAQPFGWMEGA